MYYLKRILGCIKKADNDYNLIHDGDKIAIGVSGGKDSLILLVALNNYKRMCESTKSFEICAIHLKLGFKDSDLSPLEDLCKKENIPLHIIDSDIASILQEHKEHNGRLPCSICSRMKKAAIVKAAKELNCNKISFAHHGDDAIETLVMNAIYGGRIATFSPSMHLEKNDIIFIRPLIYAREREIARVANKMELPIIPSTCPNDKQTTRENIKTMLRELYHKYPSARDNFLLMLHNPNLLDLWYPNKKDKE